MIAIAAGLIAVAVGCIAVAGTFVGLNRSGFDRVVPSGSGIDSEVESLSTVAVMAADQSYWSAVGFEVLTRAWQAVVALVYLVVHSEKVGAPAVSAATNQAAGAVVDSEDSATGHTPESAEVDQCSAAGSAGP